MFTDMMFEGIDGELTIAAEAAYWGVANEKIDIKSAVSTIGNKIGSGIKTLIKSIRALIDRLKKAASSFVYDKLKVKAVDVPKSEHAILRQVFPLIGTYVTHVTRLLKRNLAGGRMVTDIIMNVGKAFVNIRQDDESISDMEEFSESINDAFDEVDEIYSAMTKAADFDKLKNMLESALHKEPDPNEPTVKIPVKALMVSGSFYSGLEDLLTPLADMLNNVNDAYAKITDPLHKYPAIGTPVTRMVGKFIQADTEFVQQISTICGLTVQFNAKYIMKYKESTATA